VNSMTPGSIAVIGAYHTPIRRVVDDQSLEEMIFDAARATLADAALTWSDIDAIVIATSDQYQGRVIESMVTAGAAGAVGKDLTTVASAGEHAFVYAYLRLLAGQGKRVLALTWGKPSESVDPWHAELVEAEPFYLRRLGMNHAIAAALQANAYRERFGLQDGAVEAVLAHRAEASTRANAMMAPSSSPEQDRLIAWPLRTADLPHQCDVAAGMVLATAASVPDGHPAAWIDGVGWMTDRYELGERDLSGFAALAGAAKRAMRGFSDGSFPDVVEVQEISSIGSFAACEALGLCPLGEGAKSATGAKPVVNPSGGNLPAHPGNAAGFLRLLSAAQQVRGRAADVQVMPYPATAVGATLHGFAGQGATVAAFAADPDVAQVT
jgi:acetyl-CoA C-acetyltransferase